MKRYHHGKVKFRWCDTCGTLVLGELCGICGRPGREFEVSAPGDLRPCFGRGVEVLEALFDRHFGTSKFLRFSNIFFNKVPGEDRTDEIIIDGRIIGILRFDLESNDFKLDLKADGAALLADRAKNGVIHARKPQGHLKGKKLDGTDIKEIIGKFRSGDPLVVLFGRAVAAGEARVDSCDALNGEKVVHLKDVGPGDAKFSMVAASWDDFIKANRKYLRALESKGVSDIKSFANNTDQPITVSFSGGKDSLAAYGLAKKALKDFDLVFIDTGLEFPETLAYVRRFAKDNDITLREASAGRSFWEQVGSFGPPAKDFRWCCKVCKLGPATEVIEKFYPKGAVTVEGNRALESFARSEIGFVERNPFVPNQTILNPIRDWRAIDVWGYIWLEKMEYNPLYEMDYERIGCYLCASCLGSEWKVTGELHPELFEPWEEFLGQWARQSKVPEDYVRLGFWRWKVLPPKMKQLAERIEMKVPQMRGDSMELRISKGSSPCVAGGYSMEGVLAVPRKRDFSKVAEVMKTLGKVKYSGEFEVVMVKVKDATIKVFGGGHISVIAPTKERAEELFREATIAFVRGVMCTECGICVKNCKFEAITLKDGPLVNEFRCKQCGKCAKACVVAHYYDKLVVAGEGPPYAAVK